MQTSSQWRHYAQQKTIENQFFINGPKCEQFNIFGYLSLNPKYEKKIFLFFILGGSWGGGGLHQTQGYQNFRTVRPYHRADICITREKNQTTLCSCEHKAISLKSATLNFYEVLNFGQHHIGTFFSKDPPKLFIPIHIQS